MTTKRLIRISYFTMLTVIGSLIHIPAGVIPFTFQTFFVILSGFVLGRKDGAFSQIAFMVIGLVGLPVFSGGGGIDYVLRPSFGYILSFSLGAYTAGFVMSRFKTLKVWHVFFAGVLGLLPIYIVGAVYQVIIYMTVNGFTFYASVATLINLPFLFLSDSAMLFLLSLFYPRIMTMIGATKKQKMLDNGLPGAPKTADGGATDIAAAKDKPLASEEKPFADKKASSPPPCPRAENFAPQTKRK